MLIAGSITPAPCAREVLQSFGLSPEDDVRVETTPPSHSKGRQLAQTSAEMIVNMVPVFGGSIAVALTVALNLG
jgi:hypothetical protein